MKTVILAGGYGTRLAEETDKKPKPMVEVGDWPILRHIMNIYGANAFKDFIIALGYKGEVIKEYFSSNKDLQWNVQLIDTGIDTATGGRLKKLSSQLEGKAFLMTYGDGVANVNVKDLVAFHRKHGKLATVTAVRPPARFGGLEFSGNLVTKFVEKSQIHAGWINGGFFVLEPQVLDYIDSDQTMFEREPLERLAQDGQLVGYQHDDFWQCMDTLRDVRLLNSLWEKGEAPWKIW